jgi:hypothetical protein
VKLQPDVDEHALLPPRRKRTWRARGLTTAQERWFKAVASVLSLAIVAAWVFSVVDLMRDEDLREMVQADTGEVFGALPSQRVSRSILDGTSSLSYLNEAAIRAVDPLRGYSGALTAAIVSPGEELNPAGIDESIEYRFVTGGANLIGSGVYHAPEVPGIYRLALEMGRARRSVDDFSFITMVPFGRKQDGRIGSYLMGEWPYERGGTPRTPTYAIPRGFIEVTPENVDTPVSQHFTLRDFLTKGQEDVWPKYLLLNPKLLDKLELMIQELQRRGVDVQHVTVMSGFRHPHYNYKGGNVEGRANLSRHMYGDAADVFVDNQRRGWMDDITGDGKVDIEDAKLMEQAADAVERKYPSLTGGLGIYPACCGHGPMLHLDVRGHRARWVY